MAEEKKQEKIEREYIIPLRREWLKVQAYRRAARAAQTIKKFIAKHMKIADRDLKKVKLDIYLNNELFYRGIKNPPSKIKVKAIKENDIVRVELAEIPEILKFKKARHQKIHKKEEKKKETKESEKTIKEEKTEEKKKEEIEKEKSVEEKQIKDVKAKEKAEKHTTKTKEPQIVRRSMNRH
ncbi:MAG: 60S ribosomal protein L31 [Candidatus Pacearchaeota archaeon]|nr:60S ribosomal protein L31 [Candidatus Pacearchaeota archaeon]